MIPIEQLLTDLERALGEAAAETGVPPTILADPAALLETLVGGEQRRLATMARTGNPFPRFCLFSVTWRCNLRCRGCYARHYAGPGGLSLDEIRRVLTEARDLGCFLFVIVGGEPLLVDGLIETLAGVDGVIFFLFTNGTLLGDGHADAIAAARNILPILSTEGGAELTDDRRGRGVGTKVARAMQLLRDRNVAFGTSSMVSHRNAAWVTSRAHFDGLWNAGARFAFLIDYVPMPGHVDEALVLTADDRAVRLAAVEQRYAEARPLVLSFPPDEYTTGSCQSAGRGFLHINADGFAEPCPFSHYAADNVREKSLEEIIASPFFSTLRDRFACEPNPGGECLLCAHDDDVRRIAGQCDAACTEREGRPGETPATSAPVSVEAALR